MVSIPACFSETYADARAKFCSAAATAGGALQSRLNPHVKGPSGELLYLDTARFGPADAANMLVLISSTHGVEGLKLFLDGEFDLVLTDKAMPGMSGDHLRGRASRSQTPRRPDNFLASRAGRVSIGGRSGSRPR